MWPFKKKHEVRIGRRYCPNCGKRIDIMDTAYSTNERVHCRTCNRFVWITQDWSQRNLEGTMTEDRLNKLNYLIDREKEDREKIKNTEKSLAIKSKFCTFCSTKIDHTFRDKLVPAIIENKLQCPNCGDIRFYENVEVLNG